MSERTAAEIELLRGAHPGLEFRALDGWVRLPSYPLQQAVWGRSECEVAFRVPELVGQPPYAFWVRPGLQLVTGAAIQNYSFPASTPFGDGWGQFSWSPNEWRPAADIRLGSNMLHWVQSFEIRLEEGS
jgi:hypothetical protein